MSKSSKVRVRDVASLLKGKKPVATLNQATDRALPYILIESFGGDYRLFTNDAACVRCEPDDTIVVADGANTGLSTVGHCGYLGSTLAALRPDRQKITPCYLFYFVQSNFSVLNSRTRGAAVPHLEKELLLDLEFALPPLAEQERLVRILDEAEALRRIRTQADEKTNDSLAALFQELFLQNERRGGWPIEKLERLLADESGSIRTGPFGSQLLHSEFVEEGVPVLGIDNVVENEFRWTNPRCIPREKFDRFRRFQVFPQDVLITIMGTVGRCCVAPDDLPVCMSTKHLCVLTLNRMRVLPRFVWATLLLDPEVRAQTQSVGSGAIMEGWNSTIIRNLTLRVPPIELQVHLAARIAEIRALQAAQTVSRQRLDDLFQSLLQLAFQGEL